MLINWLQSFRLRTLPLSLATIGIGSVLAFQSNGFQWSIFVLTLITAILLQVLSNLSNDFGDFTHGADSHARIGPSRAVQSGKISPGSMRIAISIFAVLSLISGLLLLYLADLDYQAFIIILIAGVLSILAAMAYTLGAKPYGYRGLGDIFVFLFFGWVGVVGTFYLHVQNFSWDILLPATSCGLLITGVLNVNNIRDIRSDREAGKRTLPVIIGQKNAKVYHLLLITFGWIAMIMYVLIHYTSIYQWLFLLSLPLFIFNVFQLFKRSADEIDPLLKQLVVSILLFSVLFAIGEILRSV